MIVYLVLTLSLLIRPNFASWLFVASATVFQYTLGDVDGSVYFLYAALCDFSVCGVLYRFGMGRKTLDMMLISIVSMMLNLGGWLLWFFYYPPVIYVECFHILYAVTLVAILNKGDDDVGGTAFHIDYACDRPNAAASC